MSLLLRPEDRVEDLARVLDLEARPQAGFDLRALGAGDGHLRGEQSGAGGTGAARRQWLVSIVVGRGLDGPEVAAAGLDSTLDGRVELVGELAQPLGDHPVGALACFLEMTLSLALGVVDHARGSLLGGIDDPRQALGGICG
jgi:hypothetical protein